MGDPPKERKYLFEKAVLFIEKKRGEKKKGPFTLHIPV